MKRFSTILMVFLMSSVLAFGQDILDVPAWDGTNGTPLVDVIAGDTLANGDRAHQTYRLEREGVYVITSTLFANYSFNLIGADGEGRPPILISGKNAEGAVVLPFITQLNNEGTFHFENIIFQAVNTDLVSNIFTHAFEFNGNGSHITFKGCIFNAWTGRSTRLNGNNTSLFFRDCIWRNNTHTAHPFVGQQIFFADGAQDTLIVTNSSSFNANGFWSYHQNGIMDYCVIEHNTFYISMTTLINQEDMVKGFIRSNIFYGLYAIGDHPTSRRNKWFTFDSSPASLINFNPLVDSVFVAEGYADADRDILLTNNSYFTPQAFQDYYASNDTIDGVVWLNERMQKMFDDNPLMVAQDNWERDPLFVNREMDEWHIAANALNIAETNMPPAGAGWGETSSFRYYDELTGNPQDILLIPWPLAEGDLAYSDAVLLTGGHDGLPVGNLNWDPASKAQYVEPQDFTSSLEEIQTPSGLRLAYVYPNPFSDQTTIDYSLSSGAEVNISVYNSMGQEVTTLVNGFRTTGSHSVVWDASDAPVGLYTLVLKAGGISTTNKILKLK